MKEYIEKINNLKKILNESSYDEILDLKKWDEEEKKKIDDEFDKDNNYHKWKRKTERQTKMYFRRINDIIKKSKDPYELKGDINANYVYHYTDLRSLEGILSENIMYGDTGGISFTSNPNLYKRGFIFQYGSKYNKGRNHTNTGIKIKFDFNKMKNDNLKLIKGNENMGTHAGENEIRLKQDELENPIKYITEIIIIKTKDDNYQNIIPLIKKHNIKYTIA